MKILPLLLAGTLQIVPLMRSMLPTVTQALVPSGGAIIFRWAVGAAAMFGYHAISSASSIAISPANATVGQPYVGTVTYSGGHAGDVRSITYSNSCIGVAVPFAPGLTIVYNGGNTASVSGTPTTASTFKFGLTVHESSACGLSGHSDSQATTLIIGTGGGTGVGPSFSGAPQSAIAQVGSDAILAAAASGNPPPSYSWKQGLTPIPNATNSTLLLSNVQLTNAGLYTVTASNATSSASATAFLSVCVTPGSNQLALNYTNYYPAGHALVMFSVLTNVPSGSNVYKWQYNNGDITAYSTNGNTLSLTAGQVTAAKSGLYGVVFNSTVAGNTVVNQQLYYAEFTFGAAPVLTASPAATNVASGANVTLSATAFVSATPQPFGLNQPMHFEWYRNGTSLVASQDGLGTNQTSNLPLVGVTAANAGDYTVVVTNFWGAITSAPVALSIGSSAVAPGISGQPSPVTVLVGQNASFSVNATGTAPLSYQWWKDSSALSDGGAISGATSNILTLTGVQLTNLGNYSVIITNAGGVTNSTAAALNVSSPPSLALTRSSGSAILTASTIPGLTYVVLTASNLAPPVSWSPLLTNTTDGGGLVQLTNTTVGLPQYFRLSFP